MTEGIVRTAMGVYVLRGDACLSHYVENEHRLDIASNIVEIVSFAHLIPEGGVVVNAGACLGDHTVSYSQLVGSRGHVFAFEPHPLTYEALSLNVARLSNVTAINMGLSDRQGQERFTPDPTNIGASFVSDTGDVNIEVTTLDAFLLPRLERCDFVQLDAEGLEPRILRGGRALFEKFHPTLVLEVCDKHLRRAGSSEQELLDIVAHFGYRVLPIPSHTEPELRDVLAVWP